MSNILNKLKNNFDVIKENIKIDKTRKHFVVASLVLGGTLVVSSLFSAGKTNVLQVSTENGVVGVVEVLYDEYTIKDNGTTFTSIKNIDNIDEYLVKDMSFLASSLEEANIVVDTQNVTFDFIENVPRSKFEIITYSELVEDMLEVAEYSYVGYGIALDGEIVDAMSHSEDNIEKALEIIQNKYNEPVMDGEITDIHFLETVDIQEVTSKTKNYLDVNGLVEVLTEPIVVKKTHIVKSGDSLWQIAWDNDMPLDDLLGLNPEFNENKYLQIDDVLTLENEKPRLSTVVVEQVQYRGVSYRDIETVENPDEYKNWSRVIEEGSDGESYFTEDIHFTDGNENTRVIVDEVVITPSERQLIEVGTLNIPPKKAIGTFVWPTQGRISDHFGTRGGNHFGTDIAVPTGTPVYAIDGGYVQFAGWQSGYGNLVIINHENGFKSYYGHNSRFHVSTGERVRQGQIIAAAGSTGRSTGPHVHLEIRVNGVPRNPINYLGTAYQ